MTYFKNAPALTTMIEVTLSSAQTASQGDFVLFDTIRATGSHGVSVNSSTGELSLDPNKYYRIQASIDVSRSSTTSSWRFAWVDSGGNEISAADGGYDAQWDYHTASNNAGVPNATYVAMYQPTNLPATPIRLKATTLAAASSILPSTALIIIEAS